MLIKCGECGREISDQAAACPQCGAPVAPRNALNVKMTQPKKGVGCLGGCVLAFLVLVALAIQNGVDNSSAPVAAAPAPLVTTDIWRDPGSTAVPANRYSRQILALGQAERLADFRQVIVSADEQCDSAQSALLKGHNVRTDFFHVTCNDGGQWMVSIAPDSSTKVLSCATMRVLGDNCDADWSKVAVRKR